MASIVGIICLIVSTYCIFFIDEGKLAMLITLGYLTAFLIACLLPGKL